MKNLFDSQGNPMPEGAARHDVKEAMRKLAMDSYAQGLDAAADCMKQAIQTAMDKGHTDITLSGMLILIEDLRTISKKDLP